MGIFKIIWNHVWQKDKLYHAVAGLVIFFLWIWIFNPIFGWTETGIGMVPVFIAGAGKEIYDEFLEPEEYRSRYGGDPWDFFATIFPALIAFLITLLF